jgi:hypothetical protein
MFASALGLFFLVLGLLPWLALVWVLASDAPPGVVVLAIALASIVGLFLLAVLWLGVQILRLAWMPVVDWRPVWKRWREQQAPRREPDVIDADWRERP